MKKITLLFFALLWLMACHNTAPTQPENIMEKSFDELFKAIDPAEMTDNVFRLVGGDYTVITSGTGEDYNSMVASWGGWGMFFDGPVTWCFLRANRYTLEYMRKTGTYTTTYFDEQYKDDIMLFGTHSGRDSDKMRTHALTAVVSPQGNVAYKEAKLIIECELIEITTVDPNDFYLEEGKNFIVDAYGEAQDYHKLVFGKITKVWVRQ
jgi:flavin reductase (DIM6/NTAB) family NADH-FMN oxidoreductase RutF